MSFYRKICLFLCLILFLQMIALAVCADDETTDISVLNGCRGFDAKVPVLGVTQLVENVQSAFVYEVGTGSLMYAWNPDQQLFPAGLVKILTALVAIENGNLTDAVTVKESALEELSKDTRTSKLQVDEVFTLEQLLYLVLVEGSNDAAVVVAHHVAGNQEAFVNMMNTFANELGCTNSHFTNVHGLHDEQQLSTARDVARILSRAIQNEQFSTMFGSTHYDLPATNKSKERQLESSNHLMHQSLYEIYYDERVTGGRTGVNTLGLQSIATTAQQDDMQLVCVVMGSASKVNDRAIVEKIGGFDETSLLLDQAFGSFRPAQLLFDGQTLKQYSVRNGIADVVVGPDVSVSAVVPADETKGTLSYQYKDIDSAFEAPVEKGQKMSVVEIWCGSVCLAQAPLYALNDVDANYQQVEYRGGAGIPWWGVLLISVLVLLLAAVAYIFFVRYRNLRSVTNKRRAIRTGHNGRRA